MQIHLRRLTAFAALAVGLMAQASPASAAFPDRETVAASSVSNSLDKGVTVTCPAGKRVVGSGADIGGYDLRVSVRNRAGARSDTEAYAGYGLGAGKAETPPGEEVRGHFGAGPLRRASLTGPQRRSP